MSSDNGQFGTKFYQVNTGKADLDRKIVSECTLCVSGDGKIISANALALDVLEATPLDNKRLQEYTLSIIVCPGDQALLASLFDRASSGLTVSTHLNLITLKGNKRYSKFHITPKSTEASASVKFYCVFYDSSDEDFLSEELQLINLRLEEAQSHAKLGSWERDLSTHKAVWSKEMYRLFGMDPSQEPPSFAAVAEKIYLEDRRSFIDIHDKFIKNGDGYSIDIRILQNSGKFTWVEARSETIRSPDGNALLLRGTAQDISERKRIEAELLLREDNLSASQARAKISSWQLDIKTNTFIGSKEHFRLIEQDPNQGFADSEQFFKQVHPDDIASLQEHIQTIMTTVGQSSFTFRFILADGTVRWLQGLEETQADEGGEPYRIVGTMQDVTEQTLAEHQLHSIMDLLETTQSIAKLGGWEIELQSKDILCTDEIYHILETTPDEYAPSFEAAMERYLPESQEKAKLLFSNAFNSGQDFDEELRTRTFKDNIIDVRIMGKVIFENNRPVKLTGIFQNITEQKNSKNLLEVVNAELAKKNQSLERIANYDALTHLPNRVLLSDRLEQAIIQSRRHNRSIAVAFLDLDGFKSINDRYGHSLGDEFLVHLANNLKSSLRGCDTLARIGGDEFVAILADISTPSDYRVMLDRLLQTAATPINLHNNDFQVSASIGLTLYPNDDVDAEQLLRHADQAMYIAKQAGKNQYHLFDVRQDTQVKTLHEELDRIRKALCENEFVLFYQPKVNLCSGDIIGAEALIRWQHPSRGLLSPVDFLPIIQDHKFSINIGEWVIDAALKQLAIWQGLGIDTKVSINVGAMQLQQDDFALKLEVLLSRYPSVKPKQLELEILEISAINDIRKVTEMIRSCQGIGVTFALDDFGTGYSSLSYLKQLPAEMIKIDQTFVRDMLDDNEDLSIVKGIIGLANVFKRQVIAEGVESKEHCKKLVSIGCSLAQGYAIAKPMPAEQFPCWSEMWSRTHSEWL